MCQTRFVPRSDAMLSMSDMHGAPGGRAGQGMLPCSHAPLLCTADTALLLNSAILNSAILAAISMHIYLEVFPKSPRGFLLSCSHQVMT